MLTLERLRNPTDEECAAFDVAEVGLACAVGLPGSEDLDIPACLAWIDRATGQSRAYTDGTIGHFRDDPARYDGSEELFRVVSIMRVLINWMTMQIAFATQNQAAALYRVNLMTGPADVLASFSTSPSTSGQGTAMVGGGDPPSTSTPAEPGQPVEPLAPGNFSGGPPDGYFAKLTPLPPPPPSDGGYPDRLQDPRVKKLFWDNFPNMSMEEAIRAFYID